MPFVHLYIVQGGAVEGVPPAAVALTKPTADRQDICVEKNSELPESDPSRKFKGRVVF